MKNRIVKLRYREHELFGSNTFEFKQLNLIVGENGVGKTSMMNTMMNVDKFDNVDLHFEGHPQYHWFDTNKHNPSQQSLESGFDAMTTIQSHFQSHGESILPRILMMAKESDRILFVDEPESGISIKNQHKIVEAIKTAITKDNQLFIVTHSYFIIKAFDEVINLDIMKWDTSKNYLKSQLT